MSKISIHGFAPSTYVRSARMAAIELGVNHDLKPLEFQSESHAALHPFLKMPILKDGEQTVYETAAIMAYLDERSRRRVLFPRSGVHRWRHVSALSVLVDYAYDPVVHGEDEPSDATATRVLDWADAWFEHSPYFGGDTLGAADLMFAPMLAHRLSDPDRKTGLADHPSLDRWFAMISERPSFRETVA